VFVHNLFIDKIGLLRNKSLAMLEENEVFFMSNSAGISHLYNQTAIWPPFSVGWDVIPHSRAKHAVCGTLAAPA
jgi:hypothetical protein